ncbi:MAG: hypothetical protein JWQ90_2835 [Hydrocarboniphaga sp.]|uniref:TetR family transcriptional regulator n=1 Tax=Hydrocarboniphaga sp. TaxID=2033016 RepID=UPI002635E44A|nr:TetR family transcriptional regulator [Hydrocarboniphaga sp.]MDB5970385.1 hypothetical protein [Hydrocarboniphaga sp.]
MTQTRRMGVEGSQRRTLFIDAAEEILRTEGYMAISARQVAAKAGLKTQLLYYYFLTMDELILAVVRRINQRRQQRFDEALLSSADPLRALWALASDPSSATMSAELTAIATHRETIRAEIVRSAQEFRALQVAAVSRLLGHDDDSDNPAAGIVMIAVGLARSIIAESALGLTDGHHEALMIVERVLKDLSRTASARASSTAAG